MRRMHWRYILGVWALWGAVTAGGGHDSSQEGHVQGRPPASPRAEARPLLVTFPAGDGAGVYAEYQPGPVGAPIFLLFHQAANNRAEYLDIAPRLNALGYATLAVDARRGGTTLVNGQVYRNLSAEQYERTAALLSGFEAAYPDLEAALSWVTVRWPRRPVLLLGSSYSADFVFRLAAEHPQQVRAVLSFSPMGGEEAMQAAARLRVPVFLSSAAGWEVAATRRLQQALPGNLPVQLMPGRGAHGALALSPRENPGAGAYWQAMLGFLQHLPSPAAPASARPGPHG